MRKKIQVIGKVQGVWYRKSTKDMADQLELSGFVKNLSDGSVYIEAEGSAESIDALIEWCKVGPERAVVEQVNSDTIAAIDSKGFNIKRF